VVVDGVIGVEVVLQRRSIRGDGSSERRAAASGARPSSACSTPLRA